MYLNVCTVTRELVRTFPILCKTQTIAPSHAPSFSTIRPAVSEMRKRGACVRAPFNFLTPPLTFVKIQTNGSLSTHQISAQSVQPFARYGKWLHLHVACAHVQMYRIHDLCIMHRYLVEIDMDMDIHGYPQISI